jgi:dihydrofolate reductase
MRISIIAAISKNHVIGKEGKMPWQMPADLKHFKKLTLEKPVIMGRRTFESLPGGALDDRENIVLAKEEDYNPEGARVAHSIDEALEEVSEDEEVMIAGGASVYEQFLDRADRMYLTIIDERIEGDTYFPNWNPQNWDHISLEPHKADEENPYPFVFLTLERSD